MSSLIIGGLIGLGLAACKFVISGIKDRELPLSDRKVCFVEERCEDRENPINLRYARDTFIVVYTRSGDSIRMDCTPYTNEPRVQYDYDRVMPTVLFRKSGMNRDVSVSEAFEQFSIVATRKPFNFRQHNSQQMTRDIFNQLTDHKNFMTRNDFLMVFYERLGRPEDIFKINHLNTDYLFRKAFYRIQESLYSRHKNAPISIIEQIYGNSLLNRLKRHLNAKDFKLTDPFSKEEVENLLNIFRVDLWIDEIEHPDEE